MTTRKKKCTNCGTYQDPRVVARVNRKSGGSYNRASTWRPTSICVTCATDLLGQVRSGDGRMAVERWSVSGLQHWLQNKGQGLA